MAKRKYARRARPSNAAEVAPAAPAMVALDRVLPLLSSAHRDMIAGLLAIGVSADHAIKAAAKLGEPADNGAQPAAPPARTVRPAVAYQLSPLAKDAAAKPMIARLSPRLVATFDAIRRSRTPLSRRELSDMTQRTPKQTENDVMWLRTAQLIESVPVQ